jgi:hypothetical protein
MRRSRSFEGNEPNHQRFSGNEGYISRRVKAIFAAVVVVFVAFVGLPTAKAQQA